MKTKIINKISTPVLVFLALILFGATIGTAAPDVSPLIGGDNCPGTQIPRGIFTAAAPFADTGDTTGANNTISTLYDDKGYTLPVGGADQIYTFLAAGFGANPQIRVSATSANFQPTIYILPGDLDFGGCPAGTNNEYFFLGPWAEATAPGGTATLSLNGLYSNNRYFLFIDSQNGSSGSYTLQMQDLTINNYVLPSSRIKFDFDGDARADIGVFRPSDRTWYVNQSIRGFLAQPFGLATDKIAPLGTGITEFGVFRDGFWHWLSGNVNPVERSVRFGLPNDIPVPADYTGDGHAEISVYRDGVWWMFELLNYDNNQVNGYVRVVQFGLPTDKPVPGFYDDDERADQAVYRNGEWHLNLSLQGYTVVRWGLPTDKPVPADYDGDGKTDLAVYRDGVWYILQSSDGATQFQWGIASDVPAPADYDGDGRTDAAIFRDGIWYLRQSTSGISIQQFGLANDKPIPAAFLP